MKRAPFSRRAVLAAGAGLAALPALDWARRPGLPLLTQARGVDAAFVADLVNRLEAAFSSAGRPTHIAPLAPRSRSELDRLAAGTRADEVLLFAGAGWDDAWRSALGGSTRAYSLSLGADAAAEGERIAPPLWQGLELAGAWAARHLGPRAALVLSGAQAATNLPFAFRHGLERAGGAVSCVVVAQPGRAAEAWAEVTAQPCAAAVVLASGRDADELWATAPAGLPLVTHAASGGEGRAYVVHHARSLVDELAALTAARLLGQPHAAAVLLLSTPAGQRLTLGPAAEASLTARADSAPRNRNTFPFTGC